MVGKRFRYDYKGQPVALPSMCAPTGIALKVSEPHGLLPRHPNCLYSWVPTNVGESTRGQKRSPLAIRAALRRSGELGSKKGSR